MNGKDIVAKAATCVGQTYVLGANVPKNDPNWKGPWDCAELASWALFQITNILFGTQPLHNPAKANAYTGFWGEQARSAHATVQVHEAAGIPGAFVLREPSSTMGGHIVISDGNGGTVEAHSTKKGVIRHTLSGRRWDFGILVPGVQYDLATSHIAVNKPQKVIYRLTKPLMVDPVIATIQTKLKDRSLDVGHIDGVFGPRTQAAVVAFQKGAGLLPDGEVGEETAKALGI